MVHIQDMAPCGPKGCVMTTEGNAACEAKCNATKGCAGYVFAPKTCSGQSGPKKCPLCMIFRPKGSKAKDFEFGPHSLVAAKKAQSSCRARIRILE